MYNTDMPARSELPTSKQLVRSTFIAAGVATALLITTVLPAEYGIDPTGAGSLLGLTYMGEIKTSLAEEAAQEVTVQEVAEQSAPFAAVVAPPQTVQPVAPTIPLVSSASAKAAEPVAAKMPPLTSDQKVFTLKPGEAAEIKLAMKKSAKVTYHWSVEGGKVNFDTHGDNATLNYYGYGKGRQVSGDNGVLAAAFDGKHGWFWRNRSGGDITITLNTEGDYQSLERVM